MARYFWVSAVLALVVCGSFGDEKRPDPYRESIDEYMRDIGPLLDLSLKQRNSASTDRARENAGVWPPEWGSPLAIYPRPIAPADMLEMAQDPAEHARLMKELQRQLESPVATVLRQAAEVARQLATVNPQFHDQLARRLVANVLQGEIQWIDRLKQIDARPDQAEPQVLETFKTGTREARRRAVRIVAVLKMKSPAVETALVKMTRSLDATLSREAAEVIATEEAKQLARLAELFEDLRAMSKDRRIIAAKQLDEMGVYPKAITAALVKAAEEGDMVVREGMVAGLEEAFVSGREVRVTLDELARRGDVRGVYARAALAAVRE